MRQAKGPAPHPGGEGLSPVPGPVGHQDLGDPRLGQGGDHPATGVAGTEHQDAPALQRPEAFGGEGDGGLGHRRDVPGDARLCAHPLADLEGVAEQHVERRPGGALDGRHVPCRFDLAEDLRLAEHGRVDTGGHTEQVGHGPGVVELVEVVGEVLRGQRTQLGQEVADVAHGAVEPLGRGVDLGPVAGGQHHRLRHVVAAHEVVQGLGHALARHRHPLEEPERDAAVVQPDDDRRHRNRRSLPLAANVAGPPLADPASPTRRSRAKSLPSGRR